MARARALDAHYAALERRYPVTEDDDFADLVVPNGNSRKPFHRWFHLKEAFSVDLLPAVLNRWRDGRGGEVFLDPYAGVGTSTLRASEGQDGASLFGRAYGVEANPYLHFVAKTKLAARRSGAPGLMALARDAVRLVEAGAIEPAPMPGLSSFSNTSFFEPRRLRQLLQLLSAIERAGGDPITIDVAKVCLASSVESVSSLRRDGRALRFEPKKVREEPIKAFLSNVEVAEEDVRQREAAGCAEVFLGDGRRPQHYLAPNTQVTVSVFSPPYLNNIDYTEVYKLEAWFLGFYARQDEFKQQRLRTVRSHPSVRFPDAFGASANGHKREFDELLRPLLESLPDNRYRVWRDPLFRGYFDDMLETLVSLRRVASTNSLVSFVVGNSLHGNHDRHFLVAADLMIARLAEMVGFEVVEVVVARRPVRKRHGGRLLRESVVALSPPSSSREGV